MKFEEKIKAIRMRKRGCTYRQILNEVGVSKSTISGWLRDIELTSRQKEKLLQGREISRYAGAKAQQRKRIERTEEIMSNARKELPSLSKNEIFLPGLMLYWAEGAKSNETIKFSNSDPLMIKLMMRWFRDICDVPEEKFRIALHIHELLSRKNAEEYWSKITGVPLNQFQKTFVKPTSLGQRKNILYNGTCIICVFDKSLFRRMHGWKAGFLEKISIN